MTIQSQYFKNKNLHMATNVWLALGNYHTWKGPAKLKRLSDYSPVCNEAEAVDKFCSQRQSACPLTIITQ